VRGADLKLRQRFPEALWFVGELARAQESHGHLFATLAEKGARLDVHVPPRVARTAHIPARGTVLLVKGFLRIYRPRGRFQIEAVEVRETGAPGVEAARRELVRERLTKEGVFGRPKRELPPWPLEIALVTSRNGAVLHDMRVVMARRAPWVRLRMFDARVQGPTAPGALIDALRRAERSQADLIIIARGGGAPSDFSPFDDPGLVRALSGCRLPVVTAIGHERDRTLADLAADVSVATPSAGAEVAVPDRDEQKRVLSAARQRVTAAMRTLVASAERRLEGQAARSERAARSSLAGVRERLRRESHSRARRRVRRMLQADTERLSTPVRRARAAVRASCTWANTRLERVLPDLLQTRCGTRLAGHRLRLVSAIRSVHALSPQGVLDRGYAIALTADGKAVENASTLSVGQKLRVLLAEGEVAVVVENINQRRKKNVRA
jgi:exodeoxyribonuclease VII large subunit